MLGIPMAIVTRRTLPNLRIKNFIPYQKIGGLMFYKYDDIIKLLEGDKHLKSVNDRLQELMTFMHGLASDIRLRPTHISLRIALCHARVRSNFQNERSASNCLEIAVHLLKDWPAFKMGR